MRMLHGAERFQAVKRVYRVRPFFNPNLSNSVPSHLLSRITAEAGRRSPPLRQICSNRERLCRPPSVEGIRGRLDALPLSGYYLPKTASTPDAVLPWSELTASVANLYPAKVLS